MENNTDIKILLGKRIKELRTKRVLHKSKAGYPPLLTVSWLKRLDKFIIFSKDFSQEAILFNY